MWPEGAREHWDEVKELVYKLFAADGTTNFNFVHWVLEYVRVSFPFLFGISPLGIKSCRSTAAICNATSLISLTEDLCRAKLTPLHMAAMFGFPDLCKMLLSQGADVNSMGLFGSPLYFALVGSYVLSFGTSPTTRDDTLQRDAISGRGEVIPMLLDAGSDCTVLYDLSSNEMADDDPELVEQVNEQPSFAGLAFWVSSLTGNETIFERIVQGGAALDANLQVIIRDARFWESCALKGALQRTLIGAMEFVMVTTAAFPTDEDAELRKTVFDKMDDFFEDRSVLDDVLRHRRQKIDSITDEEFPMLVRAAIVEQEEIFFKRLRYDPRFDPDLTATRNGDEGTIAHLAVSGNDMAITQDLLDAGADFTITDSEGRTPIMLCVRLELLTLIYLVYRVSISDVDNGGRNMWHYAAANNDKHVVRWLIEYDKDMAKNLATVTRAGRTPLDEALLFIEELKNDVAAWTFGTATSDCLCLLLEAGAKCSKEPSAMVTSHLAVAWGELHPVELMVQNGNYFRDIDANGNTALHHLNVAATQEMVTLLKVHCDGLPIYNDDGKTPAEMIFINTQNSFYQELGQYEVSMHPSNLTVLELEAYTSLLTPQVIAYKDYLGRGAWERFCHMAFAMFELQSSDERPLTKFHDSLRQASRCLIKVGALKDYEAEKKHSGMACLKSEKDGKVYWNVKTNSIIWDLMDWGDPDLMTAFLATEDAVMLMIEAWETDSLLMLGTLMYKGMISTQAHALLDNRSIIEVAMCDEREGWEDRFEVFMAELCHGQFHCHVQDEVFKGILSAGNASRLPKLDRLLDMGMWPDPQPKSTRGIRDFYLPHCMYDQHNNDVARLLLAAGANPMLGYEGHNALMVAASTGNVGMIPALIKAVPKDFDDWFFTFQQPNSLPANLLQMTAEDGAYEILSILLDRTPLKKNVDTKAPGSVLTAAHWAIAGNWARCLELLHLHGADIQSRIVGEDKKPHPSDYYTLEDGWTPVRFAMENTAYESLRYLVQHGDVSNDEIARAYEMDDEAILAELRECGHIE